MERSPPLASGWCCFTSALYSPPSSALPAGTPAATVKKINTDVNQMLAQKDVIDRFTNLGAVPFATTPEQFSKIARDDIVKWAKVVKESGATVD